MRWSLRAALCILVSLGDAGCATRPPATGPAGPLLPAIAIRVSELPPAEPPGRHWRIEYTLPVPATAVRFERGYPYRRTRWRMATPGFELAAAGEDDLVRRRDGAPLRGFALEILEYSDKPEKNYQLFIPYSDGGVLVYSGHFDVALEGTATQPELRYTFAPPPGEHVVLGGEVYRGPASVRAQGSGTYAYFGKTEPVRTAHMTGVIDGGFPEWLLTPVRALLPRVFTLYEQRTGQALPFLPVVFLSYGPLPSSPGRFSIGGGSLPGGVLQQDVTLGLDRRQEGDGETLAITLRLLAHEAAHLWNGAAFENQTRGGDWLHEGGAEAFAYRALLDLGQVSPEKYREYLAENVWSCAFGLAGDPLTSSGRPGRSRNYYSCGFVIAALSEAAVRRQDPDADVFSFWARVFAAGGSDGYTEQDYLEVVRALPGGPELAATLRALVHEPLDDPGERLRAALATAGARLEVVAPATHRGYLELAARRALAPLLEAACGPGVEIAVRSSAVSVRTSAPCPAFPPDVSIARVSGFTLPDQGPESYDLVRARCARGEPVELETSVGPQRVPCPARLPVRPPQLRVSAWPPIEAVSRR